MEAADPAVLLRSDENGVATLTLNRPDRLNALSDAVFGALDGEIRAIARAGDTVRCVLLRGAGRSFCAGVDVAEIRERIASGTQTAAAIYAKADIIGALAALPQPVVVAVQGHCYTGGLELALAADILYAAADARFADTHAALGSRAAYGLPQRLSRRVGLSAAKEMMLSARPIDAADALRIGLADRVVEPGALDAEARSLAEAIARHPSFATGWAKRVLDGGYALPLEDALAWERTTRGEGRRADRG